MQTSRPGQSRFRRKAIRLRVLLVGCASLVAAGVIVFLQSRASDGPTPTAAPRSQTAQGGSSTGSLKSGGTLSPEAKRVASRFILTALAREHLDEAWNLATPELRGAATHKQWLAGEMPIPPFPVRNLETTGFDVVASSPSKILLQLFLVPKPGTGYEPTRYDMTLVRKGARWRVSYLIPYAPPGLYSAQG